MTSLEDLTDEQFQRHIFELLAKELGPDGYARYLRLNRAGKGDYTKDRHKWLKGKTVADIVASMERKA